MKETTKLPSNRDTIMNILFMSFSALQLIALTTLMRQERLRTKIDSPA